MILRTRKHNKQQQTHGFSLETNAKTVSTLGLLSKIEMTRSQNLYIKNTILKTLN